MKAHSLLLVCASVVAFLVIPSGVIAQDYEPIFRYKFNEQPNNCNEGIATASTYTSEGDLFRNLVVPHEGVNPVKCAGLDGLHFDGAGPEFNGAQVTAEGGAVADNTNSTTWANAQSALIRNVTNSDVRDFGIGIRLVWTKQEPDSRPFMTVNKRVLFNFGGLTVAVTNTQSSSEGTIYDVHFAFTTNNGTVVPNPEVEAGSGVFQRMNTNWFRAKENAINTLTIRWRTSNVPENAEDLGRFPSSMYKFKTDFESRFNGQPPALDSTAGGRRYWRLPIDLSQLLLYTPDTSATTAAPTSNSGNMLTIGRPNFDMNIAKKPNTINRHEPFRGYVHEIAVYPLKDIDFEELHPACSFCEFVEAQTPTTAPRLVTGQLLRVALRAKQFSVLTSRLASNHSSEEVQLGTLAYIDYDIDYDRQTNPNNTTPVQPSLGVYAVDSAFLSLNSGGSLSDGTPFVVSSTVNKENMNALNLQRLLPNRDADCVESQVMANVNVVTYDSDTDTDERRRPGSIGVCFYDDRLEASVTRVGQTRGDRPTVAVVEVSKENLPSAEVVGYTLIVDGRGKFTDKSFGIMKDGVCRFKPESVMFNSTSTVQLIPLDLNDDITSGTVELCVNVYAFDGFQTDAVVAASTEVDVSFARKLAVEETSLLDAINNLDDVVFNRDIIDFQPVEVNLLSGVETCLHQDCDEQVMFESNDQAPSATIFRLSVTAASQYFEFRKSKENHQFSLTVPDESKGMLYLIDEPDVGGTEVNLEARSSRRVSARPDPQELAGYARTLLQSGDNITVLDSEASDTTVTCVTRALEWIPASDYFNVIGPREGETNTSSATYPTGLPVVSGCTDVERGCPDVISYSYVYDAISDDFNPVSPVLDTMGIFVKASRSLFTADMLRMPDEEYAVDTPLQVKHIMDTISFSWSGNNTAGSDAQASIFIDSLDRDAEKIYVTLRHESTADDMTLYLAPAFDSVPLIQNNWLAFLECNPADEQRCTKTQPVVIEGYPSIVNKVIDNMYAQVLTQNNVKLFVEVRQGDATGAIRANKHIFVSSARGDVRPRPAPTFLPTTLRPTASPTSQPVAKPPPKAREGTRVWNAETVLVFIGIGLLYCLTFTAVGLMVRDCWRHRNDPPRPPSNALNPVFSPDSETRLV